MAFLKTLEVMILDFNQRSTFYNEIHGPELSLRNVYFLISLRTTYFFHHNSKLKSYAASSRLKPVSCARNSINHSKPFRNPR